MSLSGDFMGFQNKKRKKIVVSHFLLHFIVWGCILLERSFMRGTVKLSHFKQVHKTGIKEQEPLLMLACTPANVETCSCVTEKHGSNVAYSLGQQQGSCKPSGRHPRSLLIFLEVWSQLLLQPSMRRLKFGSQPFKQAMISTRSRFLWRVPFLLGIQVSCISITWAIASSWDESASWWHWWLQDGESCVQVKNFPFCGKGSFAPYMWIETWHYLSLRWHAWSVLSKL